MKRCWLATTIIFAAFSAAASGCAHKPAVTEPCDLLVNIPDAPPDVNRILVQRARPTAQGLAQHKLRRQQYRCL